MTEVRQCMGNALMFSCILLAISGGLTLPIEYPRSYTKLKLINVVFRHGDRTPEKKIEAYPTDPYANYSYYPNENGLLTNAGKMRAYKLGKILRMRYGKFLGSTYYWPNVYARSTSIIRTKLTLQLVLAALYPPTDKQIWNPKLKWQPMDLLYTAGRDDLLLPFTCPEVMQIFTNVTKSQEMRKKTRQYSNLMKATSFYTGLNISNINQMYPVYSTLKIEAGMGLDLPKWTKNLDEAEFANAAVFFFKRFNYNDELIRRNGGVLLRRMIDDMDNVINGTLSHRKINLFSGHDVNVASLLSALKLFDNNIPPFTSSVILELHQGRNDKYFVKVLHYSGNLSNMTMTALNIPHCRILCPYKKFVQLTSALTGPREHESCPHQREN